MSNNRPKKRQRVQDTSYRDAVPLDDDFNQIYTRDGRLRQVGVFKRTAPLPRTTLVVDSAWNTISSWGPQDDANYTLDPNADSYNNQLEADVMDEATPAEKPAKKQRSKVSKRPHVVWMELHRQSYLDEMLRWEGRADASTQGQCLDCVARSTNPPGLAEYRCSDCFIPDLTCASCCVKRHRTNPFHRIEKWSNSSSQINVKNCTTFELLRHLHHLSLTTKASMYDFYRGLEKSTNNIGISVPKSRYRALFRSALQWHHLKLLKRGGRGNDPSGVQGTQNGELALRCPSCPWPGINLAENWQDAPENMKFLYMFFICMDANFRLKNQLVSNYSQDPGLGIGWAYMVPRKPYEKYVLSKASDDDISTCVGFQALAKANSKYSVSLRYTGVNAVVCGRSKMIFPQGVGNLHKGERYSNMDYIFGAVLQLILVAIVLVSYDVACQWFVNIYSRMRDWLPEIKPNQSLKLIPAIPKLHYAMHEAANHEVFSLNLIPGVGLSDCECPERVWAPHNPLGNSTKTQAPGSRHDVLDDHFGFWNWMKYVGMGLTLLRRYKAAVAERNIQAEGHRGLTDALNPDLIKAWTKLCKKWDSDSMFPKSCKNPYHVEEMHISEARVKKELASEEEKRIKAGGISLNNTSAASFIGLGLEIEEFQHRLERLAKDVMLHLAISKEGNLTEQRNVLRSRIRAWEQLVPIYMPGLLQYVADRSAKSQPTSDTDSGGKSSEARSHHPEFIKIHLPSQIPAANRSQVCRDGLVEIEDRLHVGQCNDALENLRQILRLKARMIQFKNKNIRGQREGTRSRAVIDRVHDRARAAAAKYRAARQALWCIRGPGDWEKTYRILEDGDVRGYQDPDRLKPKTGRQGIWEDDQEQPTLEKVPSNEFTLFNEVRSRRDGTGETRRTISWIWANQRASKDEDENNDILRVEWAKSRARAERAREEVLLLKEEMQRVLKYLDWKANWWRERTSMRAGLVPDLAEGVQAFALTQVDVQLALASHFKDLWDAPLQNSEVVDESSLSVDDSSDEEDDPDVSNVEGAAAAAEDDDDFA
ncbi:hypothetical protein CVT26_009394 [Gymnopilus dilepis]|uniref:CxC2-like cysteine cluster KDZ transposase-associated domain-containing protein n=1 Tax=Gymnopilus dilepis TaxID=231916 RepID=A0A409YIC7_9AGAR|nr:hypothetical protein CVT26_009394 [Gymnopilus dilepis]